MREIDGIKAYQKLKTIQVELRKIQQACMIMEYKDTKNIISGIEDMKKKLEKQYPEINTRYVFV